uniref:Uncharacterized protein n=1 Tax=Arundo donax TaxID=35708 RepID=A0A0A8ZRB1_ARUDO
MNRITSSATTPSITVRSNPFMTSSITVLSPSHYIRHSLTWHGLLSYTLTVNYSSNILLLIQNHNHMNLR